MRVRVADGENSPVVSGRTSVDFGGCSGGVLSLQATSARASALRPALKCLPGRRGGCGGRRISAGGACISADLSTNIKSGRAGVVGEMAGAPMLSTVVFTAGLLSRRG